MVARLQCRSRLIVKPASGLATAAYAMKSVVADLVELRLGRRYAAVSPV